MPETVQVPTKTAVSLLNEVGPKVFRCFPEFATRAQDGTDMFVTTILMRGAFVAEATGPSKTIARERASRRALISLSEGVVVAQCAMEIIRNAHPGVKTLEDLLDVHDVREQ